jgi:regulator of protease activity HflC (stomatin/prohibitin superfamily)
MEMKRTVSDSYHGAQKGSSSSHATTKKPLLQPPTNEMKRDGLNRDASATYHADIYEDTPAYQVLKEAKLLDSRFRVQTADDLEAEVENSNPWWNTLINICCCPCVCLKIVKTFTVPAAHFALGRDGRGGYVFYRPGNHVLWDPFYSVSPERSKYGSSNAEIKHGDKTVVVVKQGSIGFAMDKGCPILLPPGLHQWKSDTMYFMKQYDLNNNIIRMGPLTLVTVDEGYSAITEDNGRQKILEGGNTYLLEHRNWKFQKFISMKIMSSNMKRIEATSADNVLMAVDATVIWRIHDADIAARNSAETIGNDGGEHTNDKNIGDIAKLKNDVLKQAEASLAAFIGSVQYSDTFNVAAAVQHKPPTAEAKISDVPPPQQQAGSQQQYVATAASAASSPLFDMVRLNDCVMNANDITMTYGVRIISINIVAAVPADRELMKSLAQGAVAAAEAQKFETVAIGRASANKIEAKGEAEAAVIRATGASEAETIRADGLRKAAETLSTNDAAVQFSLIDKTGAALNDKTSFFFGGDAKEMSSLLAPAVTAAATKVAVP